MPRLLHTLLLSLLSLTPQGAAQPITTQYDTQKPPSHNSTKEARESINAEYQQK